MAEGYTFLLLLLYVTGGFLGFFVFVFGEYQLDA